MATLKNLVDETTNIKNDIVECRDTLKQILLDKKIEDLENENRLSVLIDKVNICEYSKKLYLYNLGDECEDITNGWSLTVGATSSYGAIKLTKNFDHMNLTTPSGNNSGATSRGSVVMDNYIDVSEYNKVHFEVLANINDTQAYNRLNFNVFDVNGTLLEFNNYKYYLNKRKVETLDISKINTKVNFSVFLDADPTSSNAKHYVNIYKVWLEK